MRFFQWIEQQKRTMFHKVFYYILIVSFSITFLTSGLRKMPGSKFTILPIENPVGFFFEAMHRTGIYWHFIGILQVTLSVIVYFKKLRSLAIMVMFVININIFLITIGLHMQGTPFIAACLLLGNIYLMLWHYKNFLSIINECA